MWQGDRKRKRGVEGKIAPLISSYFLPATTRVTMATPQKAVCGELWIWDALSDCTVRRKWQALSSAFLCERKLVNSSTETALRARLCCESSGACCWMAPHIRTPTPRARARSLITAGTEQTALSSPKEFGLTVDCSRPADRSRPLSLGRMLSQPPSQSGFVSSASPPLASHYKPAWSLVT